MTPELRNAPERRVVSVSSEAGSFAVAYERLVVALGSVTPAREHTLALEDIGDAIRLWFRRDVVELTP